MSRIGKHPIAIPAGVDVTIDGSTVTVKGPKGTLTRTVHSNMNVAMENGEIVVTRPDESNLNKSLHGLTPYSYPQYGCRRYRRLQEGT